MLLGCFWSIKISLTFSPLGISIVLRLESGSSHKIFSTVSIHSASFSIYCEGFICDSDWSFVFLLGWESGIKSFSPSINLVPNIPNRANDLWAILSIAHLVCSVYDNLCSLVILKLYHILLMEANYDTIIPHHWVRVQLRGDWVPRQHTDSRYAPLPVHQYYTWGYRW